MRPTVLIVCTANVCRSPLAEYLLEDAFRRGGGLESVSVGSAGIQPVRRGEICQVIAARRPEDQAWGAFAREHSPARATHTRLTHAKLVLTASRGNRAAIAGIDPTARERTFTLREALLLGVGYERDSSVEGVDAVAAFAEHLNSQRGLKPLLPESGWRMPFSRPSDPISIVDGHNLRQAQHLRTIQQVESVATAVAELIIGGTKASTSSSQRVDRR